MVTDFYFSEDIDTFKNTGFSFRLGFVQCAFITKGSEKSALRTRKFFSLMSSFENQRAYNDSPR